METVRSENRNVETDKTLRESGKAVRKNGNAKPVLPPFFVAKTMKLLHFGGRTTKTTIDRLTGFKTKVGTGIALYGIA